MNFHVPLPSGPPPEIALARLARAVIEDRLFATDWVERVRAKMQGVSDLEIQAARNRGETLYKAHFTGLQNHFRQQRKAETTTRLTAKKPDETSQRKAKRA
jgi:hypothetical protein